MSILGLYALLRFHRKSQLGFCTRFSTTEAVGPIVHHVFNATASGQQQLRITSCALEVRHGDTPTQREVANARGIALMLIQDVMLERSHLVVCSTMWPSSSMTSNVFLSTKIILIPRGIGSGLKK